MSEFVPSATPGLCKCRRSARSGCCGATAFPMRTSSRLNVSVATVGGRAGQCGRCRYECGQCGRDA
eukprot:scaffold680_cov138-Isochrysis_galbana.AAC.4